MNKRNFENKNDKQDKNIIFVQMQTGPLEQPIQVAYNLDIDKFKKYLKKKNQRNIKY